MFLLVFLGIFLVSPFSSLQLNSAPIIQDIFVSKNLNENQTTKLICSLLQGGNDVQFDWFLNGQKLIANDRIKIRSHDESSDLVIKSLSVDDIGRYFCEVKNEFGSDKKNVDLYFNGKSIVIDN